MILSLQPISNRQLLLKKSNISERLKQKIPLFTNIDRGLYSILDLSGFIIPEGIIELYRSELEAKLGHYVVSYDAEICNLEVPLEAHLCARVKDADLNPEQKKVLKSYENLSKPLGVTFVVYQNPIEYIDPYKSAIYSLYQEKAK